jgi:hypothetical protein
VDCQAPLEAVETGAVIDILALKSMNESDDRRSADLGSVQLLKDGEKK